MRRLLGTGLEWTIVVRIHNILRVPVERCVWRVVMDTEIKRLIFAPLNKLQGVVRDDIGNVAGAAPLRLRPESSLRRCIYYHRVASQTSG